MWLRSECEGIGCYRSVCIATYPKREASFLTSSSDLLDISRWAYKSECESTCSI